MLVQVRDDQPINLVGAFEAAVVADQQGFVGPAVEQFVSYEQNMREGTGLKPQKALVAWTGDRAAKVQELGERVPLVELGEAAVEAIRESR